MEIFRVLALPDALMGAHCTKAEFLPQQARPITVHQLFPYFLTTAVHI